MKALQKKTTQNKKNSVYQGTHRLAGATGDTLTKQKENKTKSSVILCLEVNDLQTISKYTERTCGTNGACHGKMVGNGS